MPPKRKAVAPPKAKAPKKPSSTPKKSSAEDARVYEVDDGDSATNPSNSSKTSVKSASKENLDSLFARFADEERDGLALTLQGISDLCAEVGLDAGTDVRALVLLWRLGSKERPGELSKQEFVAGMRRLGCSNVADLKKYTPQLDTGFLDDVAFREFYRFFFTFNLEGTMKTLEKDVIIDLLPLAIADRSSFVERFVEFLSSSAQTKRISADQWNSFLEFSNTVDDNFSLYDEDAAWPVLLDEFVAWCKEKEKEGKN